MNVNNNIYERDSITIDNINIGFVNINGINNKRDGVCKFMSEKKLDIFFLVETWLLKEDTYFNMYGTFTDMRLCREDLSKNSKRGKEGILVLVNEKVKSVISIVHTSVCKRWLVLKVADYYIACCYFPPSADNEDISEFFNFVLDHHEINFDKLLIVGDFNARLGKLTGDGVKFLGRGKWFYENVLNHFGVRPIPPSTGKWTTITATGKSVTDLLLCSEDSNVLCNDLSVYESCDLYGSDHRPLVWSVSLLKSYKLPTFTRYNRSRLEKAEYSKLYSEALHKSFYDIFTYFVQKYNEVSQFSIVGNTYDVEMFEYVQCIVDDLYSQFCHWIDDAALQSIGLVHIDVGITNTSFETDHIKQLQREMEMTCGKLSLLDPSTNAYRNTFHELKRVRDEYKQVVRERRYELYEQKCNSWAAAGNSTQFQKCVSAIKKRESRSGCQLDPDKMDTYVQHFKTTFGAEPTGVHVPLCSVEEMCMLKDENESVQFEDALNIFSAESIHCSLNFFSNGKAAGPDNIFVELIKHEAELSCQLLSLLFKICYKFGRVPAMWKKANVALIYKNKGDINNVANYRPISLTCVLRRVYERVFLHIVQPTTEFILTPNQGGFRSKRSTLHQAYALHEFMEANPWAVVCFLDITAAYDTVTRPILHAAMLELGFTSHDVAVVRSLFDFNVCNLVVNGKKSVDIKCMRGLLQGSSLSPLLFNIFIHSLIEELNKHPKLSIVVDGKSIEANNLFFADDGTLFALPSVMHTLLDVCTEWAIRVGLKWAPSKCAAMLPFVYTKNVEEKHVSTIYCIQDGIIPMVEAFVYLGIEIIRGKGIVFEKKQEERIRKMISTAQFLKRKGMNALGWRVSSSVLALKSFLRPIMEYGVCFMKATCTPNSMLEKMEKGLNRVLNMILSCASTSSRGAKLKMLNIETMSHRCAYLQYRFVENLRSRCPSDAFAAQIWRAHVKEGQNTLVPRTGVLGARPKSQRIRRGVPVLTRMQKIMILTNDIVLFVFNSDTRRGDKEIDAFVHIRKKASMATYDKINSEGKYDVAASIKSKLRRNGRSAYTDPGVSREDQRVLIALRLGEFAFHQECKKCKENKGISIEVSREHAFVCSEEALRLAGCFPLLFDMYRDNTEEAGKLLFQDFLLNRMDTLYASKDHASYQQAQDILYEMIATAKCIRESISGYVKNEKENGIITWYHPLKKRKTVRFVLHKSKQKGTVAARNNIAGALGKRTRPILRVLSGASSGTPGRRIPRAKTLALDTLPTPRRLSFDPP